MPVASSVSLQRRLLVLAVIATILAPMATTLQAVRGVGLASVDHLVISEVVTGGASASDELIELYNPTSAPLPLEGLEVIYVTSTGATITRRATWELGAPGVPAGGHVLIANASGTYASIADATYASGMAATGGSVAVRILGATTAIDAVGWGAAASTWMEGSPAVAPASGASIERLPGGALGSSSDTGDNLVDFVERPVPEPQNLGSPPTPDPAAATPSPGPSTMPEPPVTPEPTPEPTPPPSSTPHPTPTPTSAVAVAAARAAPDGAIVTIEAVALTDSGFHDGGGFVADATGGIAVLLADGTFARGQRLRITGELDDRFSQRTLRADSAASLGTAPEPEPMTTTTGAVGEHLEGRLVGTSGAIVGSPTVLSSGLAFDVDDGSGATRVLVGASTGIVTSAWLPGMSVAIVGVAGQRDSTGSGADGYRVMLRDAADVRSLTPPGEASPSPGDGGDGVSTIAEARRADRDTSLTIRGTVTLPSGLVDDDTAVIQDATGAILLRLGDDGGRLNLGARVEVSGTRSTLSGMESLRVSGPIETLGNGPEPAARRVRTGGVREADEATLVVASGALVTSARRFSSGTVSFEIDDGSGPLRVSLAAALRADRDSLSAGTWVEVRGVLGQETSLAQPDEGYRIWPRTSAEVRVTAPASGDDNGSGGEGPDDGGSGGESSAPIGSLDDLGAADLAHLRIAATLVAGRWKELGLGGLLWDGARLVAVHASSRDVVARLTRDRRPPLAVDLGGLQAAGTDRAMGVPAVRLASGPGQTMAVDAPPAPPRSTLRGDLPAWVAVVGHLSGSGSRRLLTVDGERVALHARCEQDDEDDDEGRRRRGLVSVTGVALGDPVRLLVPCGGLRSAPSIAGGAALAATDGKAGAPGPAAIPMVESAPSDSRRPIAAGLLMAAAAVLVGGAALRRKRGSMGEEPVAQDDADDPAESGPRLTLVRVPHEGGP